MLPPQHTAEEAASAERMLQLERLDTAELHQAVAVGGSAVGHKSQISGLLYRKTSMICAIWLGGRRT